MAHVQRIIVGIVVAASLAVLSDGRPLMADDTTTTTTRRAGNNADDESYAASNIPATLPGRGPGHEGLVHDDAKGAKSDDTESPLLRWALDEAHRVGTSRPQERHAATMENPEQHSVSSSVSKDFSTMIAALNRCPAIEARLPSRR